MALVAMTHEKANGLSYIVPLYNEAGGIRATLERLNAVLSAQPGLEYEIIAVNDGSRDDSAAMASEVPNVRVISHPINCGYGAALKTGIRHAKYDLVGIVDADGTYPIEEIPRLLAQIEKGFDMVVARRSNVLDLDGPVKKMFRSIFIAVVSLLVGRKVEDPNSGLRIFRRSLALTFLPFLCNAFSFTTSITVFSFGAGFFISYVPVEYSPRLGKSKVRHGRDSLRTAQLVLQGIMYYNPVKFSILISLAFVLTGFLPGTLLALLGFATAGWFVLWGVAIVALLVSLGLLFDMLRIATIQSHRSDSTDPYFLG